MKLDDVIAPVPKEDRSFIGTIAFNSEEKTLPDGSTMALGIDGGHWVLVYQEERKAPFVIYEYDAFKDAVRIDKKPGKDDDVREFKKFVRYFFAHAHTEDLVTYRPTGANNE